MNKNILLCGVGGQGTVLASKLIASAAMRSNEIVHSAETIVMAQRCGSVTRHVRIGANASSPLIPYGSADFILAFEPAEAVRNLNYLKKDGIVIGNSVQGKPVTESLRSTGYDGTEMIEYLRKKCKTVIVVNAEEICREIGSTKIFNVAILGVAIGTGKMGLSKENIISEIETRVKESFREINLRAFEKGEQIGAKYEIK